MPRKFCQIEIPKRLRQLPQGACGSAIPFYLRDHVLSSQQLDVQAIDAHILHRCVLCHLCWICGATLVKGRSVGFPLTINNAVARLTPQPPHHPECAAYATARAYPLISKRITQPTVPWPTLLLHPPTAATLMAVWITRVWQPLETLRGFLFELGDPLRLLWFRDGCELAQWHAPHISRVEVN
jgi:hypothetical protein